MHQIVRWMMEEIEGDTLTPISIYQKLQGEKKFLLESSLKHEDSGRFSFIGANPYMELKGFGGTSHLIRQERTEVLSVRPLEVLKKILPEHVMKPDTPFPFTGGAVGYAGYDTVREYEQIGPIPPDELGVPDAHFLFFEEIVVFDHLEQKVYLVALPQTEETTEEALQNRLKKRKAEIEAAAPLENPEEVHLSSFNASMTKKQFMNLVDIAKHHIEAGDVFQIVPSQRLKAAIKGDPFSLYRQLRVKNPSPYMYYVDFGDYQVAGVSPESLIRVKDRMVTTNPIAGTKPRGATPEMDAQLASELLADEKELAEHRMLVDLGRNDVGRICEFSSVQVKKYMAVEFYKHVIHLVSEVEGRLREHLNPIDALISCLPAGTVSGAPKIRAMQLLNELEPVKRGIYSGALGYVSTNGNLDFALAIRTMVIKGKEAYIQAGAGVVHDSIPEKEYAETLHKLKMFLGDHSDLMDEMEVVSNQKEAENDDFAN